MSTTFPIKQNDRQPSFTAVLEAPAGVPVPLTGASVVFVMTAVSSTTPTINATGSVTDALNGKVQYDWQVGDTAVVGQYKAEWKVTFGNGQSRRFPANDYLYIEVIPALT